MQSLSHNQSLNWTCTGISPTGLISFWPSGALPFQAS